MAGILPAKDREPIPRLIKDLFRASAQLTPANYTNEKLLSIYAQVDTSLFIDEIERIADEYHGVQNIKPKGFADVVENILSSRQMNYLDFLKIGYAYSANSTQDERKKPTITDWNSPQHQKFRIPEYLRYTAFGIYPSQLMARYQIEVIDTFEFDNHDAFLHDVDHAVHPKRGSRKLSSTTEERSIELSQVHQFWNIITKYKQTQSVSPQDFEILQVILFWLTHEIAGIMFTKDSIAKKSKHEIHHDKLKTLAFIHANSSFKPNNEIILRVWHHFCTYAKIPFINQEGIQHR